MNSFILPRVAVCVAVLFAGECAIEWIFDLAVSRVFAGTILALVVGAYLLTLGETQG